MTYQTDEEVLLKVRELTERYCKDETIGNADDAFDDLILTLRKNDRAVKYEEGYKQGKFDAQMEGCDCEEKTKEWLRGEVGKLMYPETEFDYPMRKSDERKYGANMAFAKILTLLEPKTDV